jgi:hypothetical protein
VADIENPDPLAAKTEMIMVHCDAPGVELHCPSFSGMGHQHLGGA